MTPLHCMLTKRWQPLNTPAAHWLCSSADAGLTSRQQQPLSTSRSMGMMMITQQVRPYKMHAGCPCSSSSTPRHAALLRHVLHPAPPQERAPELLPSQTPLCPASATSPRQHCSKPPSICQPRPHSNLSHPAQSHTPRTAPCTPPHHDFSSTEPQPAFPAHCLPGPASRQVPGQPDSSAAPGIQAGTGSCLRLLWQGHIHVSTAGAAGAFVAGAEGVWTGLCCCAASLPGVWPWAGQ